MGAKDVFKALADPTRREILKILSVGERTAGEIAERFDMTWPTISHHFAVLREADLVESRKNGQQVVYSINTTVLQDVMSWFLDLTGGEPGREDKKR